MWRPQEVLPEFRRRAVVVWTLLIIGILSYFILLLYRGVEKRENPNTSFVISDEIYTYPDVWVCLYNTYGCDAYEYEEQCIMSINDTEGGYTTARYRPGDEDEAPIRFTADITERGWCVIFEMSALDYNVGNQRDSDDYIDYTRVDMYWYPGGSANTSTTCIQEKSAWTAHKQNVYAYLSDPFANEVSAGIQIPYSCMTNESTSHYFTYMGVGVTKEHHIDGEETASYNALMVSTVEHMDERNADITGIQAPYIRLSLQVQQESDSMIIITEIDPLDLAEILGQVGGFWDLILILWPLVFVAASYEAPHLRPRNFRESAARVTETVAKVLPTKRQGLTSFPTERNKENGKENDELPAWERDVWSSRLEQEDEVLIRLFEDHGLVAVVDTSSRVARFLQSKFGARCLREGAGESALKNLLPPKTYLVMISTNQTAISIATSVARYCKAGGDAGPPNSAGLFTVKVTRVSCSLLQSQALAASSYVRSKDCSVTESVVDLGEEFKDRKFTSAHPGRDTGQQEARREEFQHTSASCPWPKIPREIASPARRSFPTPGASLSNNSANVHSCVQSESKQTEI